MGGALHLGTYAGIPVKVHWTFALLLLFVFYTAFTNGLKTGQSIGFILYILILFLCVVLHEFGHALTAKKYGVHTRDIVLSPIGGLARLESMPEKPLHEFHIAIAGPLVNLAIGALLGLGLLVTTGQLWPQLNDFLFDQPVEFIRYIWFMNMALFLFNLIPAFPMDGGRILRSILTVKLGRVKATRIASTIGRAFAIGFVIFGVFNQQLVLSLIGLFIFMMAGAENNQTRIAVLLGNVTAADIMRTEFTRLQLSDTYASVIEKYYREGEHNFLVFDSLGNLSGSVPELFIKDVLKENKVDITVRQLMSPVMTLSNPGDLLKDVVEKMRNDGAGIVGVTDGTGIIGVLDRHNIEDYIRLRS